jgi:transcriptional regulator with XRE-family HTH domain
MLDVEIKGWLDLVNSNHDKATLAKAIIGLANHGGGVIIIGFEEAEGGVVEAEGRPQNLAGYTPDRVNAIVSRYIEPPFHCDIKIVTSPQNDRLYPIVVVPGGHHFPIRSRRSGPDGNVMRESVYYIRRPGPQSAAPQSAQEWDTLIRRCITNARDHLLDQFRLLMAGGVSAPEAREPEIEQVRRWSARSLQRWEELGANFPEDHYARLPHGHYAVAYQLFSEHLEPRAGTELLERLRTGVIRHTGWPPFWVPTREGIAPYAYEGNIECWLGPNGHHEDPAHSDFWRASSQGQFFLIRGYQEDGTDNSRTQPGESFDLTLPTWRIGEVLLHAESMARQFEVPDARVALLVEWTGLANRELISLGNPNRMIVDGHRARQDRFENDITFQADQIPGMLPELVDRLVRPLYELFDFFQLPRTLVIEELARMRQGR